MAAYYCDTSGIAKRYVAETGSAWVKSVTDAATGNSIYIVEITAVEIVSAVTRRVRSGSLSQQDGAASYTDFRSDFNAHYIVVPTDSKLIEDAVNIAIKHGLRGYDAVQLAAALQVRAERLALGASAPALISADTELNAAAFAEGLAVENPNNHP